MTVALHTSSIDWPEYLPIAQERVLKGSPHASTLVLHRDRNAELGLWQVTPGEFTTLHNNYDEFIHVIEGEGELVHDDGAVYPLSPGTVLLLEDGWSGRWVIRRTLTKSYTTVSHT